MMGDEPLATASEPCPTASESMPHCLRATRHSPPPPSHAPPLVRPPPSHRRTPSSHHLSPQHHPMDPVAVLAPQSTVLQRGGHTNTLTMTRDLIRLPRYRPSCAGGGAATRRRDWRILRWSAGARAYPCAQGSHYHMCTRPKEGCIHPGRQSEGEQH